MKLIDKITECNIMIEEITEELKKTYIPLMEKCKTVEELSVMWRSIIHNIGIYSSDDIPGTFTIELHYQMDRCRQLEGKNNA